MQGDIGRDWKSVDWTDTRFQRDEKIVVTASLNGRQIRRYEFTDGLPTELARMFDDMLAALKQHRSTD